MPGDWIKMRAALLEHPKLIAVARAIHRNKEFREWLTPGGANERNGQIVGTRALRCVTASLLMRVWSVSREHGEFVGNDLLLRHSEINDLDQMAGAPGVGEAMQSVKWAVEQNGVTLPNFKEFNVPMSPAEKQKEYRKRNERSNATVTVSLLNESNENVKNVTSRGEKSREDNITTKENKKEKTVAALPSWLSPELWNSWKTDRRARRKAMTPLAEVKAIELLGRLRESGHDPAEVISQSIANGWTGLFEIKRNGSGMTPYQQMQVEKHEESKRFVEAIHGKRTQHTEPIDITPGAVD